MARKSSSVKVYLETVITPFQRGLANAKKMLNSFKKSVSKVGSMLTSTFSLIGIGLGAAGIKSMLSDLDKLAKSAKNLGVSGEYFQKLSFAADRSGVSIDSVFSAFVKLKKGAGDAATGNKQMIANFSTLGLTIDDLRKLSPEELFDTVVKRLNSMEDPLERDATAAALFGKSFAQLNVFLNDYKSLGDELEERGGIITNEQLEAAEKLDDMITNIAQTVKSISFNSGFVKYLADLLEGLDVLTNGGAEGLAKREIAASGGTRISREDALKLALSSGKLTGEEYQALNSKLAFQWARGQLDGKSFASDVAMAKVQTIDNAMKRIGLGELSGGWGNKFGQIYKDSTYEQGNFSATLPDWAGGKEKREAQKQKIIDDANTKKEAQKKAKEAQEKAERQKKDDAILELQKKSEREVLRKRDPVAAAIADFVDKYGEIDKKQRAKLTAIYQKEFEKEKKKEKEKEKPETGGVLGQFGADMIERSLGGSRRIAERTASATEQSAKILTEIRDKKDKGATFS